MENRWQRSALLLGVESIEKLEKSHVAVFGVGGVGSYSVEALARSGVGTISLFDSDEVCESNINRQMIALTSTIGKLKVEVSKQRILDINPNAVVYTYPCFYSTDNANEYPLDNYDFIIDAIDTVSAKIELIKRAYHANVPIISCMGAGNKLDPTQFEVTDIYKTSGCPLARVMRRELKARNILSLKVVYSKEPALKPLNLDSLDPTFSSTEQSLSGARKRQTPGSLPFVPSVAGLVIAKEVVMSLISST